MNTTTLHTPDPSAVRQRNAVALVVTLLVAALLGGVFLLGRSGDPSPGSGLMGSRLQLVSSAMPDEGTGPTATASTDPTGQADPSDRAARTDRTERRGQRRAEMDAAIAEHLGVTVDQLHEARIAALTDRLDVAVERGRLTQEQADDLIQAARDGRLRDAMRELRAEIRAGR